MGFFKKLVREIKRPIEQGNAVIAVVQQKLQLPTINTPLAQKLPVTVLPPELRAPPRAIEPASYETPVYDPPVQYQQEIQYETPTPSPVPSPIVQIVPSGPLSSTTSGGRLRGYLPGGPDNYTPSRYSNFSRGAAVTATGAATSCQFILSVPGVGF